MPFRFRVDRASILKGTDKNGPFVFAAWCKYKGTFEYYLHRACICSSTVLIPLHPEKENGYKVWRIEGAHPV